MTTLKTLLALALLCSLGLFGAVACDDGGDGDGDSDADTDGDSDGDGDADDDGDGGDADADADAGNPCDAPVDLNTAGTAITGGFTYTTTVAAGAGAMQGDCGGEGSGAEVVLTFTPDSAGDLVIDTIGTDYDTVLSARVDCAEVSSEIGCNDDGDGLQSVLTVVDGATAGSMVYIVADAYSADGAGSLTVNAMVRPILDPGATCDPAGVANRCRTGAYCGAGDVCIEGTDPVLSNLAILRVDETTLRILGDGNDVDGDVVGLAVTFLDASDAVIPIQDYEEPVFTLDVAEETTFEVLVTYGDEAFANVASISAELLDATERRSAAQTADVTPMPRPAIGERCDPEMITDRCVVGARCDDTTEQCVADAAPVLTAMTVVSLGAGWYRTRIEGSDAEGNITHFQFTFIDASNADVPDDYDGIEIANGFNWNIDGDTSITVGGDIYWFDPLFGSDYTPEGATGIRVELVDVALNVSNSLNAQWIEIPVLDEDAACDPLKLDNICDGEAGLVCDDTMRCSDPATMVTALCGGTLPELVSGTAVTVDITGGSAFTSLCGGDSAIGRGPEAVYMLEVAATSSVTISTNQPGSDESGDTVVYVRSACGDDADTEVGCNDDDEDTYLSALEIESLEAGSYYVIVDTYSWQATIEILATVTAL